MTSDEREALRARLREQRKYPETLGYSCTAAGVGGGWRQGYEAGIDTVLTMLLLDEQAEKAKGQP